MEPLPWNLPAAFVHLQRLDLPLCSCPCSKKPTLRLPQQYGLESWQPGISTAPQQQAAAAAAAGAEEGQAAATTPSYEELLQQLPGLRLQLRVAAQERVGLATQEREADQIEYEDDRYPRKPEPQLDEWDLRAKMERRRRQQHEMQGEGATAAAGLGVVCLGRGAAGGAQDGQQARQPRC